MTENAMSEEAYRKWLNGSRELDKKFEKMLPNLIQVEKVVESLIYGPGILVSAIVNCDAGIDSND